MTASEIILGNAQARKRQMARLQQPTAALHLEQPRRKVSRANSCMLPALLDRLGSVYAWC